MFFWNFLAFSVIQEIMTIWSLVPLPFLNPAWTSQSSRFMYCWSLGWRILSIALIACEMSALVKYSEHYLTLPFFGIEMKTDLFQFCDHCWVFHICWHIECSPLTALSFRIWNSLGASLVHQLVKKSACNTGDPSSITGLGRVPEKGQATLLSTIGLPLWLSW